MSNELVTQNEAALEMQRTNNVADVCRGIVRKTVKKIQGKDYVQVEGWQSIATAHGCVAGSDAPVYLSDVPEKGYQARGYITHIATGNVISTAYGFVGDDEVQWAIVLHTLDRQWLKLELLVELAALPSHTL